MIRNNLIALIKGNDEYPNITGTVTFQPYMSGTWISANITGLPSVNGFHGFHLHTGNVCDKESNFETAGGHYNPTNEKHPYHAGDFPPLLASNGIAQMEFYTNRIIPQDVAGKTIIIHSDPDDFRTDPAGKSGNRIACGIVRRI